jgi:hypothetical protein
MGSTGQYEPGTRTADFEAQYRLGPGTLVAVERAFADFSGPAFAGNAFSYLAH